MRDASMTLCESDQEESLCFGFCDQICKRLKENLLYLVRKQEIAQRGWD